jgi:hypothetical protein
MDQTPVPDGSNQDKIYFNTGTWRKTWNKVKFDPANREFVAGMFSLMWRSSNHRRMALTTSKFGTPHWDSK